MTRLCFNAGKLFLIIVPHSRKYVTCYMQDFFKLWMPGLQRFIKCTNIRLLS